MECVRYICSMLIEHYRKLDKRLDELKEELGCSPLCEERYPLFREMSITRDILYELLKALKCI